MDDKKEMRHYQGSFVPLTLLDAVSRQEISALELVLWLNINSFQRAGRECWMSNDALGGRAGIMKRQVQRLLDSLITAGWVRRKCRKSKKGTERILSTRYDTRVKNDTLPCQKRHPSRVRNDTQIRQEKKDKVPAGSAAQTSRAFQLEYVRQWEARYPRKKVKEYFGKKDWAALKTMAARINNDETRWKKIVARFLADAHHFYTGHNPAMLLSQFPKFIDAPQTDDSDGDPAGTFDRPIKATISKEKLSFKQYQKMLAQLDDE